MTPRCMLTWTLLKGSMMRHSKFVWDDPALYAYLDLAEGLYDATQVLFQQVVIQGLEVGRHDRVLLQLASVAPKGLMGET